MAEYIEREPLLEAYDREHEGEPGRARKLIEDAPAADVVPVVRCKDCKYCLKADEFEYWCNGFCSPARLANKEDFCSHGKARD